jgi:hypothetical protein
MYMSTDDLKFLDLIFFNSKKHLNYENSGNDECTAHQPINRTINNNGDKRTYMMYTGNILAILDKGLFYSKSFNCIKITIIWLYLPLCKWPISFKTSAIFLGSGTICPMVSPKIIPMYSYV